MHNLLTELGEARAYVDIYSVGPPPSDATSKGYRQAFARYRATGFLGRSPTSRPATSAWHKAALRYGALAELRDVVPTLEAALTTADGAATETAAARLSSALDLLRLNPAGKQGRRRRPLPAPTTQN